MRARIDEMRKNLLDISTRNPLISFAKGKSRIRRIEIIQERSEDIFDLLVNHRAEMAFTASKSGVEEGYDNESQYKAALNPARLRDRFLQTNLSEEKLDSMLLGLSYDAQTMEEEQGVSHLHLALGFLEWFDAPSSQEARIAPLVLVPVALDRKSASTRFTLSAREDDFSGNLSLAEKLRTEFGINLPVLGEQDDFNIATYFDAVAQAVKGQSRWRVLCDEIRLAFFSFAKFLMHRDLDENAWPTESPLMGNSLISGFIGDGLSSLPPLCDEEERIDLIIGPNPVHVSDVDSSQALVIEEVKRGRNLVVQGPPGTGKSQTITNMIASAVAEGKTVLFLAEKMAALEVVKSRLDHLQLGAVCLELHSKKSNKKAVLHELGLTLQIGKPYVKGVERRAEELATTQQRLDAYIEALAKPLTGSGLCPRDVLAKLIAYRNLPLPAGVWSIPGIASWSQAQLEEALRAIHTAATRQQDAGDLTNHPWLGVEPRSVPVDSDLEAIASQLDETNRKAEELNTQVAALAKLFGKSGLKAASVREVKAWLEIARALAKAPDGANAYLDAPIWENRQDHSRILGLVEAGARASSNRLELASVIDEDAWSRNLRATRRDLDQLGRSWFRWFSSGYRKANQEFLQCLRGASPKSLTEKVALLDRILATKSDESLLEREGAQVGATFGEEWKGVSSDWKRLEAIARWRIGIHESKQRSNILKLRKEWKHSRTADATCVSVEAALSAWVGALDNVRTKLGLAPITADSKTTEDLDFEVWKNRISLWRANLSRLITFTYWRIAAKKCQAMGLQDPIRALESGGFTGEQCQNKLRRLYYESQWGASLHERPLLGELNGSQLAALRTTFSQLDKKSQTDAVLRVARKHFDGMPNQDSAGEMAVIRTEINKKRRHLEIRALFEKAGRAIQRIKPVFMMSPISVAQYLPRGAMEFDLLLVDEASQMLPEDAMGAIARAKQVVIVGDSKQLPPTSFFMAQATGDESEFGDESSSVSDMESLIGLGLSQGVPERMLRWHYRSKHHSLIETSNRQFYDSKLFVVPSPRNSRETAGLKLHRIADGFYDRGGSRTHREEAKAVARAVRDFAIASLKNGDSLSLGIGAFSMAQRDAIRDEIEILRKSEPAIEPFFAADRHEAFFVKNLESIQGDERDVIFISIGYGKDQTGRPTANFGPLNGDGGWRRLNVLITRAKLRCEIFSSITAGDIDVGKTQSRGVRALREYLHYAESGEFTARNPTGADFESEFEEDVYCAIAALGFEADPQVGTDGFRIDLGVKMPGKPGEYVLGVECDGASYHSSRSARDRDRLRDSILTERGWRLHRIWSTDWFENREREVNRLELAIRNAIERHVEGDSATDFSPAVEILPSISRETAVPGSDSIQLGAPLYEETQLNAKQTGVMNATNSELVRTIVAVINTEAPIHEEELVRRVVRLHGDERTSTKRTEVIHNALAQVTQKHPIEHRNQFLFKRKGKVVPRDRSSANLNLKRPEFIATEEFQEAIIVVIGNNPGVSPDEVAPLVTSYFGLGRTTQAAREVVNTELELLKEGDRVAYKSGRYYPAS